MSTLPYAPSCCQFSLDEILSATQNFDDALVVGKGGFGKVYKATITVENGATFNVAVKRLDLLASRQGASEFWAEIEMLTKLRHCNLVSLIGYCNENSEMILIYEFLPHGTLDDHLHREGTGLSWVQRLKISIGAARGLHYLHTGTGTQQGVIHRDVKSTNILLDEDYAAKIADFGLAKIGPTNTSDAYVETVIKGTFGYLDPEYFLTGRLTRKSDVFAFGVVLFELLCGRVAVDNRLDDDESSLVNWARESIKKGKVHNIIDLNIKDQISPKCLKEFVQIAHGCLNSESVNRPKLAEIVVALELSLTLQNKFDSPVKPAAGILSIGRLIKRRLQPITSPEVNSVKEALEVHLGKLKRFSLRELQVATDHFSNRNILGKGWFGTVYKGCLAYGTLVAVKRLEEERTQGGGIVFETEVEMINIGVHRNLLRLKGFCMTPTERLLVYPFMANGSVASCLRERPENQEPLDWPIRKRIALGVARGLAYLHDHCDPKIIHRNVKAANVLLDEEFEAVVGDWGLAKLMDPNDTHVTTAVCGTVGHIAPEFLSTGNCSEKTDVFSYGAMLLELITGQRVFDLVRLANDVGVMLVDWVKELLREKKLETLVDADMKGNYIGAEVEQLIQLALLCMQGMPLERPKMLEVIRMLEGDGLAERWEEWEEMFRQEFNTTHNPNADWIIQDLTYNLPPDEGGLVSEVVRSLNPKRLSTDLTGSFHEMALVREKLMEAKRLSTDKELRQTKHFQDALEVLSSNKDMFLKFLQQPNSLSSQNIFNLQSVPPPPESRRITKPSNKKVSDILFSP